MSPKNTNILIVGLTYKYGVPDMRNSLNFNITNCGGGHSVSAEYYYEDGDNGGYIHGLVLQLYV